MLRLWIRAALAKAKEPPEHHPAAHGGRPIADNPNLIRKQLVDRNGRTTTRYVRRDAGAKRPAPPRPAPPRGRSTPPSSETAPRPRLRPAPAPDAHPRRAGEEAPAGRSARETLPDGREHTLTIERIADGRAHIASSAGFGGYHLPLESVTHHFQELEKRIDIAEPSPNRYVEAVRQGKGRFLGRGEDGMVFAVGDKVVKVSTVTPYQRYNPRGFRTPEQAIRRLRRQTKQMQALHAQGVPGIPHVEYLEHGDRAFAIQDLLDLPEKLAPEQLEEVQRSVRAIHRAGYTVNDQIQVGIGRDGKPYHFDLGHAEPTTELSEERAQTRRNDDLDGVRRLYDRHGHTWVPLGLDPMLVARARPLLHSERFHAARMEREGPEPLREELRHYFADLVRAGKEDDDAAEFAVGLEDALKKRAESLGLDPKEFRIFHAIYFDD